VRATQTALAVAPPQGRILFASNRSGPNDLYRISPNGGDAARVTSNTGYLPGYAPGADRIVFTTERRGRVQLATIRPDGSDESVLDTTPNDGIVWDDWDPAVAPDGRQVAFVSTRDNQWDIYSLNLTTGAVRRLTTDPARDYSPAWSPDGRRIAFASERSGMTDRPEIWIMNADGSNPVRLTANGVFDAHPKWSPDGGQIAFASDRDDNRSIYVMNANGANVRRLTASPWMDQYPAWSSDGDWLVFDRRTRENRAQLYLVDATGSQLRPVANSASSDWGAIWLPR
jgi:TolB protein